VDAKPGNSLRFRHDNTEEYTGQKERYVFHHCCNFCGLSKNQGEKEMGHDEAAYKKSNDGQQRR
jgi:hypothetical protein